MEQSAVEWFFNELERMQYFIGNDMLEAYKQAKEMERRLIIDAFWNGDNSDCTSEQNSKEFAEQYYNKTFKKD
jgi:hypothetical protein